MAVSSLTELLAVRAAETPKQVAFSLIAAPGVVERSLTYRALSQRAQVIASHLRAHGATAGATAVLAFPAGLEFVEAFFGCLSAGLRVAPAPFSLMPDGLARIGGILGDSEAGFVLGVGASLSRLAQAVEAGASRTPVWIATDDLPPDAADEAPPWRGAPDDLAVIQYSSGSTGDPKGVMISQANILSNLALLHDAYRAGPGDLTVSWLPPYHDMGLIAGLLYPLYTATPCVLMAPATFMRRPMIWLEAISHYGATMSGGPNFAYEQCLAMADQAQDLDLRRWAVAIAGAEPVRSETLDRFAARFSPFGFDARAFSPTYGLAEASLMVSGADRFSGAQALEFGGRIHVGCGRPRAKVAVVDPDGLRRCVDGEIGEILVSGPGVSAGYWNQPQASAGVFNNKVEGDSTGDYMRTGDLGFLRDGELYVTGRLRDLIWIGCRCVHAEDVERSARTAHQALGDGGSAAFATPADRPDGLVVLQELSRTAPDDLDLEALVSDLADGVRRRHEAGPLTCCLLRPGALPRTSSGKLQRFRAREHYLAGRLRGVLAQTRQGCVD